jgi:hypothetical protein
VVHLVPDSYRYLSQPWCQPNRVHKLFSYSRTLAYSRGTVLAVTFIFTQTPVQVLEMAPLVHELQSSRAVVSCLTPPSSLIRLPHGVVDASTPLRGRRAGGPAGFCLDFYSLKLKR